LIWNHERATCAVSILKHGKNIHTRISTRKDVIIISVLGIAYRITEGGKKNVEIELRKYPQMDDLRWFKECTIGTMGKETKTPPTSDFLRRMLTARHSPIRELTFSYVIRDIPYWVSVHLVRHHVGFQPYVQSQRNDRQNQYDRTKAPQDSPVTMRVTLNAEALLNLANKRLCMKASPETREVVARMCALAEKVMPELRGLLVPMCEYHGGKCYEMTPCGRAKAT
jgi:thymidylate synthase ThyX